MSKATDWSKLEHAYGVASDIPPLLEALKSGNAEKRDEALDALEEKLYHQGHRYDATLAALPALMDVLKAPDSPDRVRMLMFLSYIAVQYPDEVLRETDWSELESDLCFNAVRDALPSVTDLLGDKSEGVRAGALALLANVPPQDAEPLRGALSDKSALVRGLAVLALGRWGIYSGKQASVLPEIEDRAKKGRGNEKALAAITWLQVAPCWAAYDAALKALPKKSSETRHLLLGGGSLFILMCQVLADAPAELSQDGERLLEQLRGPLTDGKLKQWELSDMVDACILAFFGEPLNESSPASAWVNKAPEDLTRVQREFLGLATPYGDTSVNLLSARGVPIWPSNKMSSEETQRCYLGQIPSVGEYNRYPAPAGQVGTWPMYKWLRAVFLEVVSESALREMLSGLEDDFMLKAVEFLSATSPNITQSPCANSAKLLGIALSVVRARRGIGQAVERLLKERLKLGAVSARQFPLAVYLAEREEDEVVFSSQLDEHFGELIGVDDEPWAVDCVRSIVVRLSATRRDAVVGGAKLGFMTTLDRCRHRIDGWNLLDLHSDKELAIERVIGKIREWLPFYIENIHPKFRVRVVSCLRALGDGVIPAIKAALETEPQSGDSILREFLEELRGSA